MASESRHTDTGPSFDDLPAHLTKAEAAPNA